MIPVLNDHFRENVESIQSLILSEVNVKSLEFMVDESVLVKKIKPNFKINFGDALSVIIISFMISHSHALRPIDPHDRLPF